MEESYSEYAHLQLTKLEEEHQLLLQQKEIFWEQRARIQRLKEGDNNTKFFHAHASNIRRRNTIQSLKIDNNWITSSFEIRNFFVETFKKLYTSNHNVGFLFNHLNFPIIPKSQHKIRIQLPTSLEIINALKRIDPNKAPGPDGLDAHFFQKYWTIIEPSVSKFVTEFFQTNSIEYPFNHTRVILIPKKITIHIS